MDCRLLEKSGLTFIPILQQDSVYCSDNFDSEKYINSNQVFGKATEEKLAELRNIAYCLGAKSCSVEIMESDIAIDSRGIKVDSAAAKTSSKNSNVQSGKTITHFEGHDDPKVPELKWFAHDDNVKGLIEMRLARAIKSNSLNLSGATTSVMSKKIACAIDSIVKTKISMEREAVKEHSKVLVFEIEF